MTDAPEITAARIAIPESSARFCMRLIMAVLGQGVVSLDDMPIDEDACFEAVHDLERALYAATGTPTPDQFEVPDYD